ncbi:unnamed protein product [Parnassius mnemosyne]|uniref:PiggyBac transposable element-derived protein domain-containing protein n=1 Tax=Parnassius mnemosyne TaxID=213953 RepID=A0AAV1LMQ0_9NEOP
MISYHVLPDYNLYWSSDPGFRVDEIANVMTIKRFKVLLRTLHLNDNSKQPQRDEETFDKLYKVRPLVTLINEACQAAAKNTSSQSIDESMIIFKGRSSLKQYMPMKPVKRGYKVWCKCDSSTGYLYEFDIYTGKQDAGTEGGLGSKVVKKLTEKLLDVEEEKHVTFDNFFCDYHLLNYLYEKRIFATGTVRRNRIELPNFIKKKKGKKASQKLNKGEYRWRVKDNVSFVVWQDTKEVLILSNVFHPQIERTTVNRTQKDGSNLAISCPLTVREYTKRMGE